MEDNFLEQIAKAPEDYITCRNKRCDERGDEWKCYMGNEGSCKAYQSFLREKSRVDEPLRHRPHRASRMYSR